VEAAQAAGTAYPPSCEQIRRGIRRALGGRSSRSDHGGGSGVRGLGGGEIRGRRGLLFVRQRIRRPHLLLPPASTTSPSVFFPLPLYFFYRWWMAERWRTMALVVVATWWRRWLHAVAAVVGGGNNNGGWPSWWQWHQWEPGRWRRWRVVADMVATVVVGAREVAVGARAIDWAQGGRGIFLFCKIVFAES
jgi:hypothetical protein